jgi:hypothetical protein
VKPGQKTTEFIVSVCVIVGAVAFAVADKLPPRYAAIASAIAGGAYAISRGLAKIYPPKPGA